MFALLRSLDPTALAAIGAVGSAMLAAIAYVLKLRFERKRTVRLVLFQLFQLRRHIVLQLLALEELPAKLLDSLRTTCGELGVVFTEAEFNELCQTSRPAALAAALTTAETDIHEVRIALQKSLSDLAKDSPLLAYRLALALPEVGQEKAIAVEVPKSEDHRINEIASAFAGAIKHQTARQALRSQSDGAKYCIRLAALEIGLLTLLDAEIAIHRQEKLQVSSTYVQRLVDSAISASVLVAKGIVQQNPATEAHGTGVRSEA